MKGKGKIRKYAWILLTVMLLAGFVCDRNATPSFDEDGSSVYVLGQAQIPVSDAHQTYLVTVPSVVEASLSSRISIAESNCAFEGGIHVLSKVFSVKLPVPSDCGQRLNYLKVLRI